MGSPLEILSDQGGKDRNEDRRCNGRCLPDSCGKDEEGNYVASVPLHIKHGETVTFKHIPEGVTYTVTEDAKHSNPDDVNKGDSATGYTTTYDHEDEMKITAGVTKAEGVNNEKKTEVNTGVILDSLPYVLVLALVAAGVVIMIVRRRHRNDA